MFTEGPDSHTVGPFLSPPALSVGNFLQPHCQLVPAHVIPVRMTIKETITLHVFAAFVFFAVFAAKEILIG